MDYTLPDQPVCDQYTKAQKRAMLEGIYMNEVEIAFQEAWKQKAKVSEEKIKIKAEIDRLTEMVKSQKEYLFILNDLLDEKDTELKKEAKREFLNTSILEQKKGNFRGVVAKKLSDYRRTLSREEDIQLNEDQNLKDIDVSMDMNELRLEVCKELKGNL